MPRLLFEKTGNAVYMSHLDLMRLFQRAFKRAGLPLTHTHGFNPRPSVSIALPLSVGVESCCELLDFDLEGETVPCEIIAERLNAALVEGVRVRQVYTDGRKLGALALLDCLLTMEYDRGIPAGAPQRIDALFRREQVVVEKKSKNGVSEQNIIPMIRFLGAEQADENTLLVRARICCREPSLNPNRIVAAIEKYLPDDRADFVRYKRLEIYDSENRIFR